MPQSGMMERTIPAVHMKNIIQEICKDRSRSIIDFYFTIWKVSFDMRIYMNSRNNLVIVKNGNHY